MLKVLYINNNGGGFADYKDINEGTTVKAFFEYNVGAGSAHDYLIRVNREPVVDTYILQDGDRVTVTPTKIEGA